MSCFTLTASTPNGDKLPQNGKKTWKRLMLAVGSKLCLVDEKSRVPRNYNNNNTNQRKLCIQSSNQSNNYYHHYRCSDGSNQQSAGKCNGISSELCKADVFYTAATLHQVEGHGLEQCEHEEALTTSNSTTVQLDGVDAEAEKFIDSFYQRLSLERQTSTDDFIAMLNRGT